MTYEFLNALPAIAFLNWEQFKTELDGTYPTHAAYAVEQYQKGLKIGAESVRVGINPCGTWFADMKGGGMMTSYEGIGYHAHTAELLKGFIDSGCEIIVLRNDGSRTIVQETKPCAS